VRLRAARYIVGMAASCTTPTADGSSTASARHLLPAFRAVRLSDVDETAVRGWRKERLDTGSCAERPFGPVTVAKAYRLLHAIFETAVDDQMIRRNPCRIEGAGKEDSPERDVVSLPVVFAIADALPPRYRAMALLATFASMRWGELAGLRRGEHRPGRM
jgi:integrase